MPRQSATRIAILVSRQTSAALACLTREIFEKANRPLGREHYSVELVSTGGGRLELQGATVRTAKVRGRYDYLIVPPFTGVGRDHAPDSRDAELVNRQCANGTVVASACLGAFTLAEARLLDGKEATTHWDWIALARSRYPRVRWSMNRMISDQGRVITAGGYLAAVDLALYIVARTSSQPAAHALGQTLLADSARQKQSVYAQKLIDLDVEHERLKGLTAWIESHLEQPLSAAVLAKRCNMSSRTFHRRVYEAYGTTPRKFVQLKRIEKAQQLLRTTTRSVDQILARVGVSDVASFRRVFRREIGYSPAEFRRRLTTQLHPRPIVTLGDKSA
jgi:transcriptional regulator GlxA family with amidase domain